MVVRFEVDGCLPYGSTPSTPPSGRPATRKRAMKKKPSLGSSPSPPDVTIIRAGLSNVPQTHLLEIKTHTRPGMKWTRTYPQLYFSQTPHIYHAFCSNGTFTHVKKYTLGQSDLTKVEENAQEGFKKLRKLLSYIKSLVLRHGSTRISLVCVGKTLRVYQIPQGETCLPADALALFVA